MSTLDFLIVIGFVALSVIVGVVSSRRNHSLADALLGGRDLSWWLLLGSIVATETSVVTFLSIPGKVNNDGGNFNFLQLAMGFAIGRLLIATLLIPRLFDGQRYSVYEIVGRRFGRNLQRVSSATFLVTRTLSDGLRLYLAALVLQAVFELRIEWCILICGIVTIGYTWLGGFRAVVINDCIQLLIYMVAGIASIVVLVQLLGWNDIVSYGQSQSKWEVFDFTFDWSSSNTFWAGVFGGTFVSLASHGADQMMAQRYLAARSQKGAAFAVGASGLIVGLQFAFFLTLGVALSFWKSTYYPADEIAGDQLFARFMVDRLPMGLLGLALAGVTAAAMSTLSSSLNSSATTVIADWLPAKDRSKRETDTSHTHDPDTTSKPHGDPPASDHPDQSIALSRWLCLIFGVLQMLVGMFAGRILGLVGDSTSQSVIDGVFAIAAYSSGLLLGLLLLGILPKPVSSRSATLGFVIALLVVTTIKFSTSLAWPWFAVLGPALVVGIAYGCDPWVRGRPHEIQTD